MFKYLGLCWNPRNPQESTLASSILDGLSRDCTEQWHPALQADGLVVLYTTRNRRETAYMLSPNNAVILGHCFENPDSGTVPNLQATFSPTVAQKIIASKGRLLISNFWGRYVAFLHERSTHTTWVLRDPSGHLPCFFADQDGVRVFFSSVEDCLAIGGRNFSINWQYVRAFACGGFFRSHMTGLREVSELRPGECMEFRAADDSKRIPYWTPADIVLSREIENVDLAVERVRDVTTACVGAWASRFPRIVHMLSGGLDSSIVLNCLHSAPTGPAITCVNYVTPGDGDERAYARLQASTLGYALTERHEEVGAIDLQRAIHSRYFPNPRTLQYELRNGDFESTFSDQSSPIALFTGEGGDHCFFQGPMIMSALDYVHRHGLDRAFLQIAARISVAEQLSIWSVFYKTIQHMRTRDRWNPFYEVHAPSSIINPAVLAAIRDDDTLTHPWLNRTDISHGKRMQIWYLLSALDAGTYYFPFYDSMGFPDRIMPLLSQPLIELCLQIPLHTHSAGGWQRAVERLAFAAEIPTPILLRREKGFISDFFIRLVEHNVLPIREFLMGGILACERIVDTRKLALLLSAGPSDLSDRAALAARSSVLALFIGIEAWLRRWSSATYPATGARARALTGQPSH